MKWLPTSVGAEPRKLAILGVLLALAGVVYWMNSGPPVPPGPAGPARPKAATPRADGVPAPKAAVARANAPRLARRAKDDTFTPSLDVPEGVDLTKVDPRLKLDLLARVREVGEVGGRRSLFEFYTPPPPPPPKVDPIKPTQPPVETEPPKPVEPPKPPPPPPPPPPTFKFFGYEGRPGDRTRRALFVDGEDTMIVAEGDVVRDRYRVTRIGVTSVEVEDTQAKARHTLQIVPAVDQ
jgi:hypothetical protein